MRFGQNVNSYFQASFQQKKTPVRAQVLQCLKMPIDTPEKLL